jgi:hypothetical protein
MGNGLVGVERVKLHQALHGYAEGHRELASSVQLKRRDAKTMLVLSDISGPGVRIDENGYLTGYPLPDAGLYAFAKTWAAPEMARPGCIWTHTLLIDFADLAKLGSLTELIDAFRRPGPSGHAEYAEPLVFHCADLPPRLDPTDELWIRRMMGALYGKPMARVIAFQDASQTTDVLVSALWSQQWPRLRRSFRFCTLAATDRSTEGAEFDLQLIPAGNQALRTRFSKAVDTGSVSVNGAWLDQAIADFMRPHGSGLREFLRQIGGDVGGGRAAFAPLCSLYMVIQRFASEPGAVVEAIALLQDEFGASQARMARTIVASAAAADAERLDDNGLDYLLAHLDLIEPAQLARHGASIGRAALHRRPDAFASMVAREDLIGALAAQAILSTPAEELTTALASSPALAAPILRERPELVTEPGIWSRELAIDDEAFFVLRTAPVKREVIVAMIAAKRNDLVHRVISEVGPIEVLHVLGSVAYSSGLPQGSEHWLRAAAQPDAVAELLARQEPLPRQLLAELSRCVGPDDMPNDFGEDPWFTAVRQADGAIFGYEETHLRAFLLARSLGSRSRNQAELAQFGFELTYRAVAEGHLTEDSWRWLDPRLPWPILWFQWDRCQRLRAGVVNLFVERGLSPETFGHLVRDVSLFEDLVDQAAHKFGGRTYLKDVRRALKRLPDELSASRQKFIERVIK